MDEGRGPGDRSVDVALGSEVDDGVDAMLAQQRVDERAIGDVALDEAVPPARVEAGEVLERAGVGERVEVDHARRRIRSEEVVNEARPDEPGAAGDEDARGRVATHERHGEGCGSRFP